MVHLAVRMYCNWPTDHAIDHSSIGLNRLTIQLVFSEASLFTFSKGTHGFDITVPKNYLNRLTLKTEDAFKIPLLIDINSYFSSITVVLR